MRIRTRRFWLCIIAVISILSLSLCLFPSKSPRLSDAQISALRTEYPICGIEEPPMVSMVPLTLEDCISFSDSFVYGEVDGEIQYYTKYVSTGDAELDAKREKNGLTNTYQFYEYTLVVLEDTEGVYQKGDRITIAANVLFQDYNPSFSDGMRIVTPVRADPSVSGRTYFGTEGTFYITPDGYALSAFAENSAQSRTFSGIKVNDLLKNLKKQN